MAEDAWSGAVMPPATAPEVLIPPAKRYELEVLVRVKPQARYIVPAAQAVGNRIGGVLAALSWANRQNYTLPEDELKQLMDALKSEADRALEPIGVTSRFEATQTAGSPLTVVTTVSRDMSSTSFTFTFSPAQLDFSQTWSEMKSTARTRWERYINALTDGDIRVIFELAKLGYSAFLTGDSAAEQKARIKHAIAMERIKAVPEWYRQRLDPQKFEAGYGAGAEKYRDATLNIAFPAILYGFEYAKAVVNIF